MFKGTSAPACPRFAMTQSFVPFQPNSSPAAGLDDAILFGATKPDPGGLPLGTLQYLTFSRFYNVAGEPFQATRAPARKADNRQGRAHRADRVDDRRAKAGSSRLTRRCDVHSHPVRHGDGDQNARIAARYTTAKASGYTDNVVRIVAAAEGRFQRWGNWQEYDEWLANRCTTGEPARPIPGDPVDGRRPEHRRTGRGAQLVELSRRVVTVDAGRAAELHSRRHLQAVRRSAGCRRHGDLPADQHRHPAPCAAERVHSRSERRPAARR